MSTLAEELQAALQECVAGRNRAVARQKLVEQRAELARQILDGRRDDLLPGLNPWARSIRAIYLRLHGPLWWRMATPAVVRFAAALSLESAS